MSLARNDTYFAVGLMSGTSRDGIDAALIETDGLRYVRSVAFVDLVYDTETREILSKACASAMRMAVKAPDASVLACADRISVLHIDLVERLLFEAGFDAEQVSAIGFHGHTVAHRADLGWTWQAGHAEELSAKLNVCVVSDLRQNDMAQGGQGAPLLPVYHQALFANNERNVAVLNLGGVANLTWLGRDGSICAFDCGMASALIDDYMTKAYGRAYDDEGAIAASGRVSDETLAQMLDHPFFAAPYPKSIDRLDFGIAPVEDLSNEDTIATLTAFSAAAAAIGIGKLPGPVDDLIVTGGGRKNRTMMNMIGSKTGLTPKPTEEFGWNGDAIEAQGFAYMAVRRLRGFPITFPETTGVSAPAIGGVISRPNLSSERCAA
jgi:anhydro-N-acetylmuramic acid kinase